MQYTVKNLATVGAKIVIISNSSRRASTTMEKLKGLGFDPSFFTGAITSGELTHQSLQRSLIYHPNHPSSLLLFFSLLTKKCLVNRRDDPWFAALGRRCIHITWKDRGAISLEGLDLSVVENVEEADFVLAHGTEAIGLPSGGVSPMPLDELEKILEKSAARKLPMIVANPDYVTVEANAFHIMPGTLAAKYEELGGEVKWMGKPHKMIYESAMAIAGVENPEEAIAVGDSLHHDIKGANVAGIESVFITGGIHGSELGLTSFDETASLDSVKTLTAKHNAFPSYVLSAFKW